MQAVTPAGARLGIDRQVVVLTRACFHEFIAHWVLHYDMGKGASKNVTVSTVIRRNLAKLPSGLSDKFSIHVPDRFLELIGVYYPKAIREGFPEIDLHKPALDKLCARIVPNLAGIEFAKSKPTGGKSSWNEEKEADLLSDVIITHPDDQVVLLGINIADKPIIKTTLAKTWDKAKAINPSLVIRMAARKCKVDGCAVATSQGTPV